MTTIWLRLTVAISVLVLGRSRAGGKERSIEDASNRSRVLLVDDQRDIATSFKGGLERQGFLVDAYTDPEVAIRTFRPGAYKLVLLDIRMPSKSGFEVYRELKSLDPGIRVCFLTAFEVYLAEFRRLFPDIDEGCFIQKPLGSRELGDRIRAMFDT